MMVIRPIVFAIGSALAATTNALSAQQGASQLFCRNALNARPFPEFRNSKEPSNLGAPDVRRLLWDAALARSIHFDSIQKAPRPASGDYVLLNPYIDTRGVGDSLRRRVADDSVLAMAIALKLAEAWEDPSVGSTEGMADLAASLYRDWHLPPTPALRYLADPAYTPSARAKAVHALEAYWKTAEFHKASAAALCSLAARVAGLAQLQVDSTESILNLDEYALFGALMRALGKSEEDGGPSARDVVALLPPGNAVTRWTQRRLTN